MLVCQQKNEKEPYPQTGTRIGIPQYCDQHPTERIFEEHEQEILSTEIERKTVRDGRWITKEWTGKFLVLLVFGVSSDMTRLEFKRKCSGIGLYCWARSKVEREGEHFRVTLKESASKKWQRIDTSKVSAWVRRVGWRVCIANGITTLRRSARVNGGGEGQKRVSNGKGKGREPSGPKQLDKDHTGNGWTIQVRESESKDDGGRTVDQRGVESGSGRKLRIGSWNVCGFATDERKRMEIVGQVRRHDLDVVGIQESWEKDGTEVGSKVEEYAWIGKKREGQKPKSRGAGGVGFLVKDYLCDIVEVIDDTKFDESIWIRVPGERGKRDMFVGNIYMPPESKSRVSDIQRRFGEIAEDVQKYKKQGEVMLVGDFNARVGKASRPDDIIGQYGEGKKNTNGVEMCKFLESNELKTLNDRSPRPEAQWTWTRICNDKRERSVLDYIVVEHGNRKEMEVNVGVEDVGTTDHSLIWTESQQTKTRRSRRGRKLYKRRIDKLGMEEKRQEFREEMVTKCSEVFRAIGRCRYSWYRNGMKSSRSEDYRRMGYSWSRTPLVKS